MERKAVNTIFDSVFFRQKCEHCGDVGATVGCCEPRCPMNYHFMCAREAEAQFQDDKKVYCAQHSFRAKKEVGFASAISGVVGTLPSAETM